MASGGPFDAGRGKSSTAQANLEFVFFGAQALIPSSRIKSEVSLPPITSVVPLRKLNINRSPRSRQSYLLAVGKRPNTVDLSMHP